MITQILNWEKHVEVVVNMAEAQVSKSRLAEPYHGGPLEANQNHSGRPLEKPFLEGTVDSTNLTTCRLRSSATPKAFISHCLSLLQKNDNRHKKKQTFKIHSLGRHMTMRLTADTCVTLPPSCCGFPSKCGVDVANLGIRLRHSACSAVTRSYMRNPQRLSFERNLCPTSHYALRCLMNDAFHDFMILLMFTTDKASQRSNNIFNPSNLSIFDLQPLSNQPEGLSRGLLLAKFLSQFESRSALQVCDNSKMEHFVNCMRESTTPWLLLGHTPKANREPQSCQFRTHKTIWKCGHQKLERRRIYLNFHIKLAKEPAELTSVRSRK